MFFILIFILLICIDIYYERISLESIYLNLFIALTIYLIVYFLRNPTELLLPFNLLIKDEKVFYSKQIFPTSKILERDWKHIRNEYLNIIDLKFDNVGKKFISNSDDFWEGWKTFPLRMFGKNYEENMKRCPFTSQIIKSDENITSAFFSIMEPRKVLSSHHGPYKGILRYHLGLIVPPKEKGNCFISVNNEIYEWKEGEGVLFDESYKHFVKNETDYPRVILFLDVKRKFNNSLINWINDIILWLMGNSPYNMIL